MTGKKDEKEDQRRGVVICCDGTGNQFSTDPSNVLRLWRSLKKSDVQLTYYDPGVGTLGDPGALTWVRKAMYRHLDGAIGMSVRDNALQAYEFLVDHWRKNDRLFFFGFSRGAYTVRALAALIHLFGIMRPEHKNVLPYMWMVFSNEGGEIGAFSDRMRIAGGMKKNLSSEAFVHFLGVWDTVSSYGWMWDPSTLPFTAEVPSVVHVRHAVAKHECRRCFRQNLFCEDPEKNEDPEKTVRKTCVQLTFNGVHSDVGGGYPAEESGLAKIALKWMATEAHKLKLKVDDAAFEVELFGKTGDQGPCPDGLMHNESTKWGWRIVELLPRSKSGWVFLLSMLASTCITAIWDGWVAFYLLVVLLAICTGRLAWFWRGRPRRFDVLDQRKFPAPKDHPSVEARGRPTSKQNSV